LVIVFTLLVFFRYLHGFMRWITNRSQPQEHECGTEHVSRLAASPAQENEAYA